MSITDELREWASVEVPYKYGHQLTAIADRIDAEHEESIQQVLMGEGSVPATDENMAELGWVRLPKDADGEYIHVGDEVEEFDMRTVGKARGEVIHILFNKHVTNIRINTGTGYADRNPWNVRHCHRVPTVEDVLTEMFAKAIERGELTNGAAQTIAEYAAKLRLAEVEDA